MGEEKVTFGNFANSKFQKSNLRMKLFYSWVKVWWKNIYICSFFFHNSVIKSVIVTDWDSIQVNGLS